MIKLINTRGRVITVTEDRVEIFLRKGFAHLPPDQREMTYSQIHDKGDDAKVDLAWRVADSVKETNTIGDTLEIEIC